MSSFFVVPMIYVECKTSVKDAWIVQNSGIMDFSETRAKIRYYTSTFSTLVEIPLWAAKDVDKFRLIFFLIFKLKPLSIM